MDTPLLALTRRRSAPRGAPALAAPTENMRQLIQLRWIAVAGQLVTILTVHLRMGIDLPLLPMLSVVGALAIVNVASTPLLRRHQNTGSELLLALLFDIGALTLQLYLSGGASNPFISLLLIQIVLGAILLETQLVWIVVAVASLSFAFLSVQNLPLVYPRGLESEVADLYTLGSWLSFVLIGTLLVLFTTRISRNLRARDAYLADMRQRAVEEDHIVRMGLFASGAAHELGTPLASLSVILSDWRRMPKLANDPEIAGEIDEMLDEVQRCKAVVTDILHSAGEPRGEELASTSADAFLHRVIGEWRAARAPGAHLADRIDTAGAIIIADPALRQAIWNLLDNAAEASPDDITLDAARDGNLIEIVVRDRGQGFDPAVLKNIGKPYQSRKGPGHGVGLFLVSNVMRRLDGRMVASNRIDGGAEVKLSIPLVSVRKAA